MKSILIINGSRILILLFADLFEKRGWSVDVCSDRQCVIQRLAGDWPYESILVGRVSGTDEVQLVGLIRRFEHRKTAAVVVLADNAAVSKEALAAGADEVLVEPVNPNVLLWSVDKHMVR